MTRTHFENNDNTVATDHYSISSPDIEEINEKLRSILIGEGRMSTRSSPRDQHRVKFSESSMLFLYHEDPDLTKRNLCFSSADRRTFTRNALQDAVRIKSALLSRSHEGDAPLKARLDMCDISQSEILGIEHLVLENPRRTLERRKAHLKVILMEQSHLKQSGSSDVTSMARLSAILTKRPAKLAQRRAAMAA